MIKDESPSILSMQTGSEIQNQISENSHAEETQIEYDSLRAVSKE